MGSLLPPGVRWPDGTWSLVPQGASMIPFHIHPLSITACPMHGHGGLEPIPVDIGQKRPFHIWNKIQYATQSTDLSEVFSALCSFTEALIMKTRVKTYLLAWQMHVTAASLSISPFGNQMGKNQNHLGPSLEWNWASLQPALLRA